jgi:hypothetical protein
MRGSGSASPPTKAKGTFIGEVQRLDDALSTYRNQALVGLEPSGLRLSMDREAA